MRRAEELPSNHPVVDLRSRLRSCRSVSSRRGEPVTCGVPLPPGLLEDQTHLALLDSSSRSCRLQRRVLDRWTDGSIRWVLLDFLADLGDADDYRLVVGQPERHLSPSPLLVESQTAGENISIRTGAARFELSRGQGFPFRCVSTGQDSALDVHRSGLFAEDGNGLRYRSTVDRVEIREQGDVRVAVAASGTLQDESQLSSLAKFSCLFHFFIDSAAVRLDLAITNERPAGHRGGIWELGSSGSIYLRDVSLDLVLRPAAESREVFFSVEPGRPVEKLSATVDLYQDSSGGENWRSPAHVNRHGEVPLQFQGYRLECDGRSIEGRRATPVGMIKGHDNCLGFCAPYYWQNFPKSLEIQPDRLSFGLFPSRSSDLHELQGGEQKTHSFYLAFADDAVSDGTWEWCRWPNIVSPDPDWYARSGAFSYLVPRSSDANVDYLDLLDRAIDGEDSLFEKREQIDEYGWRHFGDIYADHEAVSHQGRRPLVSHYNNQYDAIRGFAVQFMRSGDERWYRLMEEHAQHTIDIDIYHTQGDKSAYNGGLFWHTVHYTDAGTSTHRSYPLAEGVSGGGPSAGHLYTTGLMLHHFMTGSHASREAVLGLGRYVIDADDGRRTVFRLLDRGYTGHASSSGLDDYHGPGRSPANSLNALIDAHRLSSDKRFMSKAEQIIRRCIHPADDLAARRLHEAETRWYYTMFLQSLGKYLDTKAELGETDEIYAYSRASLLHYVRWCRQWEYPYLEKPEILEFPTETWAAQDLRKCVVFNLAAIHSTAGERENFLQLGRFFFDDSMRRLRSMPTSSLCRPVVLLLSLGYVQAFFDSESLPALAAGVEEVSEYGRPEIFVPQKRRVKRKLLALGFGAVALILALLVLLLA